MAIINVRKDGSGQATTIQQGIQLAQAGDIVDVEAGTFDENVDLWKGITLQGAGMGHTIVTGATRTAITSKAFTWSLGATTLNIAAGHDTSAYEVGRIVTATGIPANTRIVSKTISSLTISAATTQAATTARAVAMALQNDATIRVRGTNGIIRDMKFVGFDNPNPATEYSAIYFRNTALGSAAANGWEVSNCEFEANGEYAFLTDYAAGVGNLNIHDNVFSGKTFTGANPATGNQFSVWNVPRQLITIQSVNSGSILFQNNQITGITGGLTIDGVQSFNTAVTIDPVGSVISGNVINTTSGYGYGLRARGLNSSVENNVNIGTSAGYYILPNHSVNISVSVGTMVFVSSKFWICTQAHTSSALNSPTGAEGSLHWSEITLEQVNNSGDYGVGIAVVGTNNNVVDVLVTISQSGSGQPMLFSMSKNMVKSLPQVTADAVFSDESNWKLVSFIFKKSSNAQRIVSSFRDFEAEKSVNLKSGMVSGDDFELHKIIISKADRTLLVMKRDDIEDAQEFDFTLQ
jgi:hypothetical protein